MTMKSVAPMPLLRLRVLVYWDDTYKIWGAQCLETGHLVTADDSATVESMITELLEDEILYNLKSENIRNLLECPAQVGLWWKWLCCRPHVSREIKERGEFLAEVDIRRAA